MNVIVCDYGDRRIEDDWGGAPEAYGIEIVFEDRYEIHLYPSLDELIMRACPIVTAYTCPEPAPKTSHDDGSG